MKVSPLCRHASPASQQTVHFQAATDPDAKGKDIQLPAF